MFYLNRLSNRNAKKVLSIFFAVFVLVLSSRSYAFDYGQLIGEWAKAGDCDHARYIYTKDGQYQWLQRKSGNYWNTIFKGVYITISENDFKSKGVKEQGAVVIAEGLNMGGSVVQIQTLNADSFKGYWDVNMSEGLSFDNPNDAFFEFVRCQKR